MLRVSQYLKRFGSAGAVTAVLTGCSSLAPPATAPELADYTGSISRDLTASSPPFTGRLDVREAVHRAISYNQKLEVARYDAAIDDAKARVERGELLPDVITENTYYRRSNRPFSRSNRSGEYSTSSDLATLTRSIEVSYNLLDFGLTYIRLRQVEDRANQKYEEVRRVSLQIAEDTRATYWRAVALQTLLPAIDKVTPGVNEALRLSSLAIQDAALDPLNFINFQRDLLNTRREMNDVFEQLAGADHQLRNLTNILNSGELKLDPRRSDAVIKFPTTAASDDVDLALRQRPEIRQAFYEMRITEQEVHAAILKVLPGATLTQSLTSDSNSFLMHGNWVGWSAQIVTNLMGIARLPGELNAVDAQQEFNRRNAMAMAAAIAMQVHVARARLAVEFALYRDAADYARNQAALLTQVKNSVRAGRLPEQMIAREELSSLLAEVRAIVAYGQLEAAYAGYHSALGTALPQDDISN